MWQLSGGAYSHIAMIDSAGLVYGNFDFVDKFKLAPIGDGLSDDSSVIDETGIKSFGDARKWDDVGNINFVNIRPSVAAGSPSLNPTGIGFSAPQFAPGDSMEGATELFHKFVNGDSSEYHFHYWTGGTDVTQRYTMWTATFWSFNNSDSVTYLFSSTIEDTIPANTRTMQQRTKTFGRQATPSLNIGAIIVGKIKRETALGGAAPTANPFGAILGVHRRVDSFGSASTYTK